MVSRNSWSMAIVVGTVLAVGLFWPAPAAGQAVQLGDVFPRFVETDVMSGDTIDLAALRGKVVLIDFWATWCVPCVQELPHIKALLQEHHADGLEVVGVSLDQTKAACKLFVKVNKLDWHHICDGKYWNAELAVKHEVKAVPRSYLLGRDGRVVAIDAKGDALESAIENALRVSAAANVEADDIEKQARERLQKADDLRAVEAYNDALELYDEIGVKFASRPTGQLANARARELRDKPAIVQKINEALAKRHNAQGPERGSLWLSLGQRLAQAGKIRMARECFERILRRYPGSAVASAAQAELERLPG